jgi:peptide/nickel transport system permease protein
MLRFTLNRLAGLVLVLLFLTASLFLLHQASPGDPAKQVLGANASASALQAERHKLYLDRPIDEQYAHYIQQLVHGDLGISTRTQRPVASDLARFLPPSIELGVLAMLLAVVLGLLMGTLMGMGVRGSSVANSILVGLGSIPSFLLGLLLVIIFYGHLYWLPAGGQTGIFNAPTGPTHVTLLDGMIAGRWDVVTDSLTHLILPVVTLAVLPAVAIARVFRSSLSGTKDADYVRTARAKGLAESKIVRRHAIRNSSGPAMSMTGLQVGGLFASLAVVEVIFAWPGVGSYVAQSIPSGDFPGIAGVTLVVGIAYVITNAVVDILQVLADPRIRI